MRKIFPYGEGEPGYVTLPGGIVQWKKKSFVSDAIDSEKYSLSENIGIGLARAGVKRFIFYITMVNAQLVFHSFMFFSQLRIYVTTEE
jgi:hypothetical protein